MLKGLRYAAIAAGVLLSGEALAQLVDCEKLAAGMSSGNYTTEQQGEMAAVYQRECAASAPQEEPATVTFTLRNRTGANLEVIFKSDSRSVEWPGNDRHYILANGKTGTYKLNCMAGEQICYGASTSGLFFRYWGRGANHENSCSDCCYVCGVNVQTGTIGMTP